MGSFDDNPGKNSKYAKPHANVMGGIWLAKSSGIYVNGCNDQPRVQEPQLKTLHVSRRGSFLPEPIIDRIARFLKWLICLRSIDFVEGLLYSINRLNASIHYHIIETVSE